MDYNYDLFFNDYDDEDDILGDYQDDEDLEELLAAYQDGYEYEQDIAHISLYQLYENCLWPTITQTLQMVMPLIAICFVFRIVCILGRTDMEETGIPKWFLHLSSAAFGLLVLQLFFGRTVIYLVVCCLLVYVLLLFTSCFYPRLSGICVSSFIVTYIILCELYIVDEKLWHSVRGPQIILSMKVIGLGFDMSSGSMPLPSPPAYLGYIFCVGTVIFGPWISFQDYNQLMFDSGSLFDVWWFLKVVRCSLLALMCMSFSTCFLSWIISEDSSKYLLAYRDAQSFRFSHYFVSLVSETTATLVGIRHGDFNWNFSVSKPQHIEIPRSLVEVVTTWNLPMHYWLKNYVFKIAKPYGIFPAVILTYAASSLLHGLNFQLAAVLFSLGFYSYVEFVFRDKLSRVFSACIQAKSCKEGCSHEHKFDHPWVRVTNLCFGFLSVFHLAYLGLMFDSSSEAEKGYNMSHTLKKWSDLNYVSHLVVVGTYIFHLLI